MRRLACLALVVTVSGCTLDWFQGGDDDPPCRGLDNAESDALGAPLPELLNPETLQCQSFGGGYCDPACGPCDTSDQAPPPSWAYCYSGCEGLDETSCMDTSACRAVYDYACYTGDGACPALVPFIGCYGVDQSGPIQGSCAGLSAQECSRHDDCIALHEPQCSGGGTDCYQQFVECRDESTCWGIVNCDALPPTCPPSSTPEVRNGCYTGNCIPLEECEPAPCTGDDCG